jgi:hypothetical protein
LSSHFQLILQVEKLNGISFTCELFFHTKSETASYESICTFYRNGFVSATVAINLRRKSKKFNNFYLTRSSQTVLSSIFCSNSFLSEKKKKQQQLDPSSLNGKSK